MVYKCKVCGEEKDGSEFWLDRSKHRCKACLNASMRESYHAKYRNLRIVKRVATRKVRVRLPSTHSDIERAYMAGIMDGEGYIGLAQHGRGGGKSMRIGRITLNVRVVNTNRDMMEWIATRWPSALNYQSSDPSSNRKARWVWSLNANNALHFLDEVYPFMVARRPQAKVAIRFQRYLQYTGKKRSEKTDRLQEQFAGIVRLLNHRGLRP